MNVVVTVGGCHDVLLIRGKRGIRGHITLDVLGVLQLSEDHVVSDTHLVAAHELEVVAADVVLQLREDGILLHLTFLDDLLIEFGERALLTHSSEVKLHSLPGEGGAESIRVEVAPFIDGVTLHEVTLGIEAIDLLRICFRKVAHDCDSLGHGPTIDHQERHGTVRVKLENSRRSRLALLQVKEIFFERNACVIKQSFESARRLRWESPIKFDRHVVL